MPISPLCARARTLTHALNQGGTIHFVLYGMLTSFPVDSADENAFLLRRCIGCRRRVPRLEQTACDECIRKDTGISALVFVILQRGYVRPFVPTSVKERVIVARVVEMKYARIRFYFRAFTQPRSVTRRHSCNARS